MPDDHCYQIIVITPTQVAFMPDNPEHLLVCNRSPSLFIMTLSGKPVQTRTPTLTLTLALTLALAPTFTLALILTLLSPNPNPNRNPNPNPDPNPDH